MKTSKNQLEHDIKTVASYLFPKVTYVNNFDYVYARKVVLDNTAERQIEFEYDFKITRDVKEYIEIVNNWKKVLTDYKNKDIETVYRNLKHYSNMFQFKFDKYMLDFDLHLGIGVKVKNNKMVWYKKAVDIPEDLRVKLLDKVDRYGEYTKFYINKLREYGYKI